MVYHSVMITGYQFQFLLGYYWDSFLKECKLCSWCFPDIFKKTRTLRVSDCMISEISEDFQCAKLIEPPYEQISWIEKQKTLQKGESKQNL